MDMDHCTIAVDLTPVLPGGENGGAKVFVLELLRRLAESEKHVQFILLTRADSHEELAMLDRPNMRRLTVLQPAAPGAPRARLRRITSRILPHLPGRLRRAVGHLACRVNLMLKRGHSGKLLQELGVDLLFCPFTAPTYAEAGIPTVCTVYDLQYRTYPEFFAAEDVVNRGRTFTDACRKATMLAAISNYSRDSAILHGHLDPCRIRTVYLRMAQRIADSAVGDITILENLGLSTQRYLVYPANFWKHKNHEMLFAAFGMATHDGLPADIKIVCTGAPGERQAWLDDAVHAMGLGDRVVFPGYLSNEALAVLISNARGMVFPSLYEGFGLPVIEAMAAGVPVACSNTTSLPEVAADAAIYFDPRIPNQIAQAILSLVGDDDLRTRLVRVGKERARGFSDSELMTRQYWELFQSAMSGELCGNLLIGTYEDGWVGGHLDINIGPASSEQTLEVELSVPKWMPHRHLSAYVSVDGSSRSLKRGVATILSMPIGAEGGRCQIRLEPTFVPAYFGLGDDGREISAKLLRCRIVHSEGEHVDLFPEGEEE